MNILDLEPQHTPEHVQKTLSDWRRAIERWNTYRAIRKEGTNKWQSVIRLASLYGCTNQNIIVSLDRVEQQIILEHPELSEKGGDHHNV